MADAATAGDTASEFNKVAGHVLEHVVKHALWMIPMAAMMMPDPTILGSVFGAFEMLLTSFWDFAFDGGIIDVFNNTMEGNFLGDYEWGAMDMSGHVQPPAPAPELSESAKKILGIE